MNPVHFQDLGLIGYQKAWDYQTGLFEEILAIKSRNRNLPEEEWEITQSHLLLCEHPPVYTLGKSGSEENLIISEEELKKRGIEFFHNNRGGDITFHGPQQIVGYPILDLEKFKTDIGWYMRSLEEVMILTLKDYDIVAGRLPKYTGVWLNPESPSRARKICAFGVKCSRWTTMHGWAFNVNTDLDYFNYIIPCGITDKAVTSMQKELGRILDMEEIKGRIKTHFQQVFNCELLSY